MPEKAAPAATMNETMLADAKLMSPMMTIRFEGDLRSFTPEMEMAFLAKLARHLDLDPATLYVVSRTAGSVALKVAVRGPASATALAKFNKSSMRELSAALGCSYERRSWDRARAERQQANTATGTAMSPEEVLATVEDAGVMTSSAS